MVAKLYWVRRNGHKLMRHFLPTHERHQDNHFTIDMNVKLLANLKSGANMCLINQKKCC
jgi:hypothetical protein